MASQIFVIMMAKKCKCKKGDLFLLRLAVMENDIFFMEGNHVIDSKRETV